MAKYNLDELSIMAKERRIDSSNLQDVIESLKDYSLDNDTVRYIFEELSKTESLPQDFKDYISEMLDNYDTIVELSNVNEVYIEESKTLPADVINDKGVENVTVGDIMEEAPKVASTEANEVSDPSNNDADNNNAGESAPSSDEQEEVLVIPPIIPVEPVETLVEEPVVTEPVMDEELIGVGRPVTRYAVENGSEEISLVNDAMLGAITALAIAKGIKIIKGNIGVDGTPEISFELNNESKPYLDHILGELYGDVTNNLDVSMTKVNLSGQELLTVKLNEENLTLEEIEQKKQEMFAKVHEIIEKTDKEKDYESTMPLELRELKDKFHADDPEIPKDKDFEIGYSHKNGENTFYIVADTKIEAKEIAELIGYEVKEDKKGGVFELDTNGVTKANLEGTKLAQNADNLNDIEEVKGPNEQGLTEADVNYNDRHYGDDDYTDRATIINFVSENKDPDQMAFVRIDEVGDQRIVNCVSANGTRESLVINDGKDFDNHDVPKIIEAFGKESGVEPNNTEISRNPNGTSNYQALSGDNTYFMMNNYNNETVAKAASQMNEYAPKAEILNLSNTDVKTYEKKLGVHPSLRNDSNNEQAAKVSVAPLIAFVGFTLIMLVIIFIIFGV